MNSEKFIIACIRSVIGNNPDEFYIIDGNSTDSTLEIIDSDLDKERISVVSESDSGQSEAINKGLRRVKGDVINWINSDDLLEENSLAGVSAYFRNSPEIGFIHGKTIVFDNAKSSIVSGNPENAPNKYLSGMSFPQPSAFFHRRVLDEIGFLDESLHYGFDYDFYVRIALNFPVIMVPDVISRYRLHSDSKTVTSHLEFAREWCIVWNRVVRSIQFPQGIIDDMRSMMLYNDSDSVTYKVSKTFSSEELEEYFLYFLYYQVYFRYEGYDFETNKRIISFLRKKYPKFYSEYKFQKLETRLKLGPGMIKKVRSILR